jgi:outer membrane immunogenic protein
MLIWPWGLSMRRMSVALIVAVSTVSLTQIGSAADLPVKAPVYKAPVAVAPSWTGFYIGVNGGYGWSNGADIDLVSGGVPSVSPPLAIAAGNAIPPTLNTHPEGFIYGGQIGYNYQLHQWVLGVEADLSGSNINGSATQTGVAPVVGFPFSANASATGNRKLNLFGTVRGRLGFTPNDALLVYGTGGVAYGHVESSTATSDIPTNVIIGPAFGSASGMRTGWTGGGGLEWTFAPHWSLKAEYLYYDLGNLTYTLSPNSVTTCCTTVVGSVFTTATAKFTGSITRLGLNYRF